MKSSKTFEQIAVVRESECIGCTKCIQACPVDAIIGASKQMHTILADVCTGCELCLPPCPVDCIDLIPREKESAEQKTEREMDANIREKSHELRMQEKLKKTEKENLENILKEIPSVEARKKEIMEVMNRTGRKHLKKYKTHQTG